MNPSNSRPKWWRLYSTFPLLVVLFIIDGHLKISNRGHQVVQIGVLLLVYSLILFWLKGNSVALSQMDQKQYSRRIVIVSTAPLGLDKTADKKQPMFIHSDLEVNGLLSNTFDMSDIDPQFPPMNEVSRKLDQE